jgi:hypothetical protein
LVGNAAIFFCYSGIEKGGRLSRNPLCKLLIRVNFFSRRLKSAPPQKVKFPALVTATRAVYAKVLPTLESRQNVETPVMNVDVHATHLSKAYLLHRYQVRAPILVALLHLVFSQCDRDILEHKKV